ncbi:NERD domain-containing protein [Pseudomonas viridiflava]|uniref:NERD domain-containing protein/DEAD/DEAH box helicase n=1 Tax=Pseudomonas viridiflava TaxID=33069 RepID=UPI000F015C91|nr:NERD domain-containing protein/DEAD/DEAH box helicase [Pseudomonas viridiflava]MCQ9390190.1 NERD domain-containing protein [Pseudomonas viridiflava]
MARMIPDNGPRGTESKGERDLYTILKAELPNDYVVIHSLPWLSSAVTKVDPQAKPTGEIDFLIIHPDKGLLVLEVKSGEYGVKNNRFVHLHKQFSIDPIGQTRNNVHGIAKWLGADPLLRLRIGYGFVFPDSDFAGKPATPGMFDMTSNPPHPLYIDHRGMLNVTKRIVGLMDYWKVTLRNSDLGEYRAARVIEYLTPEIDGKRGWASRIFYDNKDWLQLTEEQSTVVTRVLRNETSLVTGWPGTGKTLIVIETARRLVSQRKKVLVVSFNNKLTDYVRTQLVDAKGCDVVTWHGLCGQARNALGRTSEPGQEDDWYRQQCVLDLKDAIEQGRMAGYGALLVDESQALLPSWCETLTDWFHDKPKAFFCDETQVFPYERENIPLQGLSKLLGVDPFPLTIILRMPKAVTSILEEVVPPKLQHSTPRTLEHDTAVEIISADPCKEASGIRRKLIDSGVSPEDIIILLPKFITRQYIEYLKKERPRCEYVTKFRGLEAPVILILGAEMLDTTELFSAYSRATSKCIAIYNASSESWSKAEAFRARLKSIPANQILLQEEKSKLRIDSRVARTTEKTSLNLVSLNISWAESWRAWLVESDDDQSLVKMWIAYLTHKLRQPIFFWPKGSTTNFYLAKANTSSPDFSDSPDSYSPQSLTFYSCEDCGDLTPHTDIVNPICKLCETKEDRTPYPDQSVMDAIRMMDGLVSGELAKNRIRELQPDLPLNIAAAASLFRAERKMMRSNVLKVQLPEGRRFYLIAYIFVQVRIATAKPRAVMDVNALADEIYGRFNKLQSISSAEWRKFFASAMSTFYSKGYMIKISKGFYSPVEDDQAPVPQRNRFGGNKATGDDGIDEDGVSVVSPHHELAPERIVEE